MLDFGLGLGLDIRQTIAVQDVVPVVQETVRVIPTASQGVTFLTKSEEVWGWSDLRDYVIREIEKRHGPQVRDPMKEAGIFKSFMSRWPDQSVAIAKVAFGPVYDGMWQHAPISVNRFCRASDDYFASPIAARL
jgi:hypothetical protein